MADNKTDTTTEIKQEKKSILKKQPLVEQSESDNDDTESTSSYASSISSCSSASILKYQQPRFVPHHIPKSQFILVENVPSFWRRNLVPFILICFFLSMSLLLMGLKQYYLK